jgi:hypothetical protein
MLSANNGASLGNSEASIGTERSVNRWFCRVDPIQPTAVII